MLATDAPAAAGLLVRRPPAGRGTTTLWFAASRPPLDEPTLVLDGEGTGPINHLAVLDRVAPTYAPPGASLVAANVIGVPEAGDAELTAAALSQLWRWFGNGVSGWRLLRLQRIRHALPAGAPLVAPEGLVLAGDHVTSASLHGALLSGRLAAERVLAELGIGGSAA